VVVMAVSVVISVIVGVALGVASAQSDRFEAILRPVLDTMQTMPAFVYLIPVLMFFGGNPVTAVIATVIYSIPPMIRMTTLGLRQLPPEINEVAAAFGSTGFQALLKVKLPMASPSIMLGVNQAVVMARHGVPVDRSVLADWMGRTGALIAPVVDHMARRIMADSTRLYVDETTAPVLDPGRGKTKTGYLWAVLRDDRGWNGPAPPGVVFHYRPGRKGEYADEILTGFSGTIQVDAYGGYTHLAKPDREGGKPLKLAFCWAHGRRKLIKAMPKKGSPIVDAALVRIAALYKIEDAVRGSDPDRRRAVRQELSRPLVDDFFAWLAAQAARVSRKSDLGVALAYMLRRQDGFRLFLEDGRVDIDSNLIENAIRSPAMNRRNALFAGHDEGGRNWARFASLIGTCKMNGVEPCGYLRDLFTRLAGGHLDKDIDALMPWAHAPASQPSQ